MRTWEQFEREARSKGVWDTIGEICTAHSLVPMQRLIAPRLPKDALREHVRRKVFAMLARKKLWSFTAIAELFGIQAATIGRIVHAEPIEDNTMLTRIEQLAVERSHFERALRAFVEAHERSHHPAYNTAFAIAVSALSMRAGSS